MTTPSSHWFTRSSPTTSTTVSVYWSARSPQKTTAKLQRVLNAAARVSGVKLRQLRPRTDSFPAPCSTLARRHWPDPRFRLCVQVYKWQQSMAPGYLVDLCRPVSNVDSNKHLRSANRGQLQVPRSGCQPTEAVLLDMPVHLLGTLCRTFLNGAHTLYLLLDAI